jgi:esterase/lipase
LRLYRNHNSICKLIPKIRIERQKLLLVPDSKHVITLDYDRERIERETVEWLSARR